MKQIYLVCAFLCTTFISFAQIPANNEIQNAVNITSLPFTDYNVQTQNATVASGGGMNGCDYIGNLSRVYYRIQPIENVNLNIDIEQGEDYPTIASIYESSVPNATSDSELTSIEGNCLLEAKTYSFLLQSGVVYYILIHNPNTATNIHFKAVEAPANNEIQNAVNIASLPFTDAGVQTQNATAGSGGMNGCNDYNFRKVYYRYVPSVDETIAVRKSNYSSTQSDSDISAYTSAISMATQDSDLTVAPGSYCSSGGYEKVFDLVANQVYYFLVSNPDVATNISFETIQRPPNNGVQTAIDITGLPFVDQDVQTHTTIYTSTGNGLSGCSSAVGSVARIYYRYKPTNNITLRVNLSNGHAPTSFIVVYQSSVEYATSDTQLTYNSDGTCANGTNITVDLLANQVYYILVRNQFWATDIQFFEVDDTNIVNIPDPNFKNALINQTNPVINTNGDTEIQVSEAFFVDIMHVSNLNISDLTGIEAFTNLEGLSCLDNNFSNINLSQNLFLNSIDLRRNSLLSNVDLSNNIFLEWVYLGGSSSFSNIDLSQNVNLKSLTINDTSLASIDLSINTLLERVDLNRNLVTTIDLTNNTFLKDIRLDHNLLTNIDLSQNTLLETFYCQNNQLTQLDITNNINIINLACPNNEISNLEVSQCQNLEWLFLNGNNLSTINLNNNSYLVDLSIRDNPLVSIDLSQNLELFYLNVSGSLMQNIDLSINSNLVHFDAGNSEFIETINFKNNYNNVFDTTDFLIYTSNSGYDYYYRPYFNTANNPNLQTICVDDVAYATTKLTNIDPNTVFVDDCSINSINYNSIQGTLAFDDENNGCDTNDFVVANQLIQATDGVNNMATFTNSTGDYTLYLNENTYNAQVLSLASNFSATPNPYNTTFTGFGNSENADFCITSSQTMNDVNVVLLPITQARPGFDANYQLVFENTGTTLISGDITLTFDDASQTFVSSNPTTSASTSNSLTFNYSNLQPFEIRTIDVVMNTFPPTTVNDGDILNFTATINPTSGDNNQTDNTFVLEQTVVNSYDPNDKQVLQGTEISLAQASEYLDYMIRFQNTGSASAINVVITDVLSNKLDWSSIRPISSSHEFTTRIINGDFVEFTLENINLPAQIDDDAGSNGFVAFKIKPKTDVAVGDVILGKANIYFDFNAPIITNTVSTEIITVLSIDANNYETSIKLYPNPVNDYLNVKSKESLKQIAIYDVQGRQIKTIALTGNTTTTKVDLSSLSKGVYFVKIKTELGEQTSKIVKE